MNPLRKKKLNLAGYPKPKPKKVEMKNKAARVIQKYWFIYKMKK